MSDTKRTEAFEVVRRRARANVLVTCEHASQRMPAGYEMPGEDRWLLDTHWAYDLGASSLAVEMAAALDASLVQSRYSRLLIDPNRPEDSPTLFRDTAEGRAVSLNSSGLHEDERARRIDELLRPYHEALDAEVARSHAEVLVSVHSFTPVYEGDVRELEIGVLFTEDDRLAAQLAEALDAEWNVALNEPYSGKDGLMYSVDRHARTHGRRAIELEVRQDLAVDPAFRRRMLEVLLAALEGV